MFEFYPLHIHEPISKSFVFQCSAYVYWPSIGNCILFVSLTGVRELNCFVFDHLLQVIKGVTPDQQLIKFVSDQLLELMGEQAVPLNEAASGPTVILMAGEFLFP